MRNLFGEGRHPDAERLEDAALDAGASVDARRRRRPSSAGCSPSTGATHPEFVQETATRFTAYNLRHGLHWKTPVPAEERARIRTELGNELFPREHGRAPIDDREARVLPGQGHPPADHRGRRLRPDLHPGEVGLDAVGARRPRHRRAGRGRPPRCGRAHAGVAGDSEVLFTRRGRGGVQQVKARGLIAAQFTHRDARSGDPHLHTHVAVSNKVQDLTGRWLAVDGRVALQGQRHPLGDVQHPPRGRAHRPARGAVREPPPRSTRRHGGWAEAAGARDRRRRRAAGRRLVARGRQRHRGPPTRPGGRLPGRARPPADRRGGRHAGRDRRGT